MSETVERVYHELHPEDCEGFEWRDMAREQPFDRMPLSAHDFTSGEWGLGHSSTGVCCNFETDSTAFWAKLELLKPQLGEPNFNVCAFSGVDLYIYDDAESRWRWAGAYTNHMCIQDQHPDYPVLEGIEKKLRKCRLYFPMRNRLGSIAVGLDAGAVFRVIPPRLTERLVYYGTSIIHGAYSTRSGLGTAQILGRLLDMPVSNLGFSGGCHMKPPMTALLATLKDVKCLVVDPMHNMTPEYIDQYMPDFLDTVCPALADTQVFFVTAPRHLQSWLKPEVHACQLKMQQMMADICAQRMAKYPNLHFIDGQDIYGSDEVSPDGIHPNDHAMCHEAEVLAEIIGKVLGK